MARKSERSQRRNKLTKKGEDRPYKKQLVARTENQKEYIKALAHNDITFCTGPAGTGKTHVAIGMAVQMVLQEFLDRIIITRPLVGVGKDMGFLPGGIEDKVGPYVTPCFDELSYYLSNSVIGQWTREKKIEVVPLSMMRGRTFNGAFVILDEAQNATRTELRMLLTRIGEPSRLVLSGDLDQSDLPEDEQGSFEDVMDRLNDIEGIGEVELTDEDIVRHRLIGPISKRLWS